jgi:hypothetical protein
MLNEESSSTTPNNDFWPKKFLQKKNVLIIIVIAVIIMVVFTLFYLFKSRKPKPTQLTTLEKYQETINDQTNDNAVISNLGDYGHELNCQIFMEEINYPNKVFGNFIIQAAAPCWFYDDNQIYDDNRLSSVDIPIVIEDISEQRWYTITTYQFVPIFTNMDKELAVQSFSQFAFARPPEELSSAITYDSIVVKILFAQKIPYQNYHEPHYRIEGEYIPKPEYDSERFLQQLADQHQNSEAIDNFIQTRQWNKNLDEYLFYYYAERKLAQ